MTERIRPRRTIMLHGPRVDEMLPGQLASIMQKLGDMGITATVISSDLAAQLVPGLDQQAPEQYVTNSPKLVRKYDIGAFAAQENYNIRVTTQVWNALRGAGRYYPLTPRASVYAAGETQCPIFYYDSMLITPGIVQKSEAARLNLEKGFTLAGVSSDMRHDSAFRQLWNQSQLDVYSLREVISNGTAAGYPGMGDTSLQLASDFCTHALNTPTQLAPPLRVSQH